VSRRQDVIDAAVALLRESGPAALTSTAVATRLGVTQPAIYRHITDMDELNELASQQVVAELTAAMMAALDAPEMPWGDGTHLFPFARRIVEVITTQGHSFEVLDRWRFDDGELGTGIRDMLELGCATIADFLERHWRYCYDYETPFDDATGHAQLAHARLIADDVIITTRIIRQSNSTDLVPTATRLFRLRIFAGWYAYNHDITRRCGLPTPSLGDRTLRVPDLSSR
jgi:AcrR family transcriptional regulator